MNIYFSGIGGVGIGPLAEIAYDTGHRVAGSDIAESPMIVELKNRGINTTIGQDGKHLQEVHRANPIDLFVYTAALPPKHPELCTARTLGIRTVKRDELLSIIIADTSLQLVAVAGTHGKTTTSSMFVWLFKQLGIPVSYSVGAHLSFGPSGVYTPGSSYFVYECDEYDRNFLHFNPHVSLITSVDYDHPDTYPTKTEYIEAFNSFIEQSDQVIIWKKDTDKLILPPSAWVLHPDKDDIHNIRLTGIHNRQNAALVAKAAEYLHLCDTQAAAQHINTFPGSSRRFEKLTDRLYSDYGHHPAEIAATLQLASELSDHIVLVYQPHQNVRQHEIRSQYTECFDNAESIYWLPTYLSRENPTLPILSPPELYANVPNPQRIHQAELDDELWSAISQEMANGKLVVIMGAGTLDSWCRTMLQTHS